MKLYKPTYPDEYRIHAIPRRKPADRILADNLTPLVNRKLRKPRAKMRLWPIQCLALYEIAKCKGGIINIKVGGGKALVSLLAPLVLKKSNPLLVVPASLKKQTLEVIEDMSKHFTFPIPRVESYTAFSLKKNADLLYQIKPDCIIMDEAHRLANPQSARTRRFGRFLKAHDKIPVIALSGTLINKSLRDVAHISKWCLGNNSPLPMTWTVLNSWADTVDVKVHHSRRISKSKPYLDHFRTYISNRFVETQGVITSWESDNVGASIYVRKKKAGIPDELTAEMELMNNEWVRPDGCELESPLEKWRHLSTLSLGFYYRWTEEPPPQWLEYRQDWNRHVRETIRASRGRIDAPSQVPRSGAPWENWASIKDSFTPVTEPVWISDYLVDYCIKWAEKNNGIVWVPYGAFGTRLKEKGLRYIGGGKPVPKLRSSLALSIRAHGEGKNLQHYHNNLFPISPTGGKVMEQVIARTHRPGQRSDEVNCTIMIDSPAQKAALTNVITSSKYIDKMTSIRQKLTCATFVGQNIKQTTEVTEILKLIKGKQNESNKT